MGAVDSKLKMESVLSILDIRRRGRQSFIICLALAVMGIIWMLSQFTPPPRQIVQEKVIPYAQSWLDQVSVSRSNTLDLSHLEQFVHTPTFSYARRSIKTKFYGGERPDLTKINEPLFGAAQILDRINLTTIEIDTLDILTLDVPRSPAVDETVMSFGMATDVSRLKNSLPQLRHWLDDTHAQLHVLAPPANDDLAVEREIRAMGLNLTITTNELTFAKRYFSILKTMYEYRSPQTRWLVYMDDDTFVPSLPYLINHFDKHYNPNDEVMVAAVSDNLNQVKNFGLIPYGGGGIFVSVPLAESLLQPDVWEACLDTERDQGDQIVNDCINSYSKIRPSWDLGLNQMDLNGDVSGYFESGRRFLTLHHWKTWFSVDVPAVANVSAACGDECILQRWQFDNNIVLSNGYSIQEYPRGIKNSSDTVTEKSISSHLDLQKAKVPDVNHGVDLDRVERTWGGDKFQWVHHIGPLRDPEPRDEKKQLLMVETVEEEGVGMRQVYIEHAEQGEGSDSEAIDRVVELVWLF